MKYSFLSFLLFLSCLSARAQVIKGQLVDENSQPVEFANIVLYSLPDSAYVQGVVSDAQGAFALNRYDGQGVLRITSIGYLSQYREYDGKNVGVIKLLPDVHMLGEVVVKSTLPRTRVKGDAMLTTVAGTVLEKAGTADNLLDKIPNVSSNNGSVSVFGRGTPEIYINKRKVYDSSELDRLAADNIKSVEVVSNPGAQYGSEVKAVIRITTKKAPGDGLGLNSRTMARYNKEWSFLEQLNFNYHTGGWDIQGMLYGWSGKSWSKKYLVQQTYLEQYWKQISETDSKSSGKDVSGMLALNYALNEKHSLGIRYELSRNPGSEYTYHVPTTVYQDGLFNEESDSRNREYVQSTNHQMNFYYNGECGEWEMDFNADWLWKKNNNNSRIAEKSRFADEQIENRLISTFAENDNSLYAAKMVFAHPLFGGKLSFGGEYAFTRRTNLYLNPEGILNDDHSKIEEAGASFFAEYRRSFGEVNVQAGVRYENVAFDYFEKDERKDEQSKKYSDFFPSVAVSFPVGKVQFMLNYASDISRPSYSQLRGNITYVNQYSYESGNPFLKPTLTHNFILGTVYRWINFSGGFQHVEDDMVFTSGAYSEDEPKIALIKRVNVPAYNKLFASLTFSPVIGIWRPMFSGRIMKQWYEADTPQGYRNLDNVLGMLSWKNSLELPGGFVLNADVVYRTRGDVQNQRMMQDMWQMSMSVYKECFNKKLSFLLRGTDLFDTGKNKVKMYAGAVRMMELTEEPNSRSVSLTVRYKFNSTKSKYKGTGAGESQKNRM